MAENETKNTPLLIIGTSGTGKTSAADEFPIDKTIVLNIEDKTLTSREADRFTTKYIRSYKTLDATLTALVKDGNSESPKYEYVLIDSFTAITEITEKYANHVFTGFEQWKQYNEMLVNVIGKIKQLKQKVIVTALPEQKDVGFNELKEYARVKGKELKYGYLESQFTVVFYTQPEYAEEDIRDKDIEAGDMIECYLKYKPNKFNTAKSPRGMFEGKITNKALDLFERVDKYYGRTN